MVTYGDVVVSQFVKVFQILATARPKGVWTKLNIPQIFRDNKPNPGICLGSRCTVQTYWWHDVVLMCAMGFSALFNISRRACQSKEQVTRTYRKERD